MGYNPRSFWYKVHASHLCLVNLVAEFAESSLEEKIEKQNMDGKSVCVISLQEPSS